MNLHEEQAMTGTNERKILLILIDGHALIHRSFHAIQQPLTVSSTGEDVRAVYGFANAYTAQYTGLQTRFLDLFQN